MHRCPASTGACSGRLTCKNPNLQALPRKGVYGNRVRSVIVPSPGYTLLAGDYSQVHERCTTVLASSCGRRLSACHKAASLSLTSSLHNHNNLPRDGCVTVGTSSCTSSHRADRVEQPFTEPVRPPA